MTVTVDGVECEYEISRSEGDTETVLFLHGWGGDLRSFAGAYSAVCGLGVSCINFAFPKRVPAEWGVYEYAVCVQDFLNMLGISEPIVVGHSFGGRIAIILASQGLCKKIMLVDSAGLKPKLNIRKKLRIAAYHRRVKRGKSLDGFGSMDYNNLEPEMRKVFVRIVNTHLDKLLPYVRCKTLIFWGKSDRDTPLYMAKRLHRNIVQSDLVVVDGGHYSYLDADCMFLLKLKNLITE